MQLKLALPRLDPGRAYLTETRPKYLQAWLIRLPIANLHESAQALLLSLAAQNRQTLPDDTRLKLLELYRDTVHKLGDAIRFHIGGMALPLTDKSHQLATLARELLVELATGYKIVLQASNARLLGFNRKPDQAFIMQRILTAHSRILTVSYEGYAAVPAGLWSEMHHIFRYALHHNLQDEIIIDTPPGNVSRVYRICLLLATADPYRLTPAETSKVFDLLRLFGDRAKIQAPASTLPENGVFRIQADTDHPPSALTRHTGTADAGSDLFFNTLEVVRHLHHLLTRLKAGTSAIQLGLPVYADEFNYQSLLQRLIRNWGGASIRHYNRRGGAHAEVEICSGLRAIHGLLSAENGIAAAGEPVAYPEDEIRIDTVSVVGRNLRNETATSNWQVLNDSADGLSLHKKNITGLHLKVGEVVAVRSPLHPAWNIGVVRWLRNSPADQIELGLQMLSPGPQPVWVRSAAGKIRTNQPALLFPPTPALQRAQQLLVPRGIYIPDLPVELTDATTRNILPGTVLENTFHFDLFEFDESN